MRRIYTLLLLAGIFYRCLLNLVHSVVQGFLLTFCAFVISILETGIPKFPALLSNYLSLFPSILPVFVLCILGLCY